jgi:hypothetical protein
MKGLVNFSERVSLALHTMLMLASVLKSKIVTCR